MVAWIKSLRLPICVLASLLAVAGFRLVDVHISWFAVVAVFFIACATMLQNDWRDRHHDVRKGKLLASQHQRAFFTLLLIFWAVSCGLVLVAATENRNIGIVLAFMTSAGLIYSEVRRIPMASVTLVALTSGSPALLSAAAGANGINAWLLFLSATLVIFGREITKDIDDKQIDSGYKWTIPLAVGSEWAKIIAVVAIMAGFAVAIKISLMTLPVFLIAVVGVIMLICDFQLRTARIIIDIGMALIILIFILIFLG